MVSGFPGLGGCEADSENSEGMVAVGTVVEAAGGFDSAADWCFEAEGVQVGGVADGKGGFDANGFEAGWRFEAESVQNEDAIIGTCGLGGRGFAAGQEEMEVAGTMGSVHGEKSGANSSDPSTMCHVHAHNLSSPPLSGSLPRGGSSVGFGGAPGWARGRVSARLSCSSCCPGCGLYGDGTLCMTCDSRGVVNSGTGNSVPNLRVVRRPERRGGTKTLRAGSGTQVGSPILDNASGDAGLADYLRWAPRSWPIEGWDCRVILSPYVEKVRFSLAGRCEVVSTKLRSAERSPVSPGPGEPLRSWLGRTAALCELAIVASGQPCVLAGDFNVEPCKIPCLLRGIMGGLWNDLQDAWARP